MERKTTSPYRQTYDILAVAVPGELSEWPKEHDWKSCIRLKRILGSNPRLSASKSSGVPLGRRFSPHGGVAEWLNAAVSKTVYPFGGTRVRIPPPPPFESQGRCHGAPALFLLLGSGEVVADAAVMWGNYGFMKPRYQILRNTAATFAAPRGVRDSCVQARCSPSVKLVSGASRTLGARRRRRGGWKRAGGARGCGFGHTFAGHGWSFLQVL